MKQKAHGNWSFPCPVSCGAVYWVADADEMEKLLDALERGRGDAYAHWRSRDQAMERLNAKMRLRHE